MAGDRSRSPAAGIFRATAFAALFASFVTTGALAQSNLRAWHAFGQTWLVWTDDRTFTSLQTYDIYRSMQPITDLDDAELVGRIYPEDWQATRLRLTAPDATWSAPDGQGGVYTLADDEALFVYTPHTATVEYFAVVKRGFTAVGPANSAGPVVQSLDPVTCHLQFEGVTALGYPFRIWAHWVDGRDDHSSGRADYPVMANAGSNGVGHVFAVWEPLEGRPPGLLPAVIQLHGGRGNYSNWIPEEGRTGGKLDNSVPGGFSVALDDVTFVADESLGFDAVTSKNTWWFGYWQGFDRFAVPAGPPPGDALVVDYTLRRVSFLLDWLLAHYPIDPVRLSLMGQSMGGFGTSSITRRFPDRFSAATAFAAPYAGHVRDPFIDRLIGTREQNLRTTLPGDVGMTAWSRHETLLDGSADLPFLRYVLGKNDESVPWEEETENVPAMMARVDALRMGQSFDWDERTHQIPDWEGHWVGSPRHDAAWLATQRRDRSFPAFSAVDHDAVLPGPQPDPGSGPPVSGDPWGTWGGYLEWDVATLVDTAQEWSVDLFVRGTSTFASDISPYESAIVTITPRRKQEFVPGPAAPLFWTLRDGATGEVLRAETLAADAGGAIHLEAVALARDPLRRRVVITPANDGDTDTRDAQIDCDDSLAAVWATPGETRELRFESTTDVTWLPPEEPGGTSESLRYDLLRSTRPDDFDAPATCVASAIAMPGTSAEGAPSAGGAWFYLSRARNACPDGVGSLGKDRDGRVCP